MIGPNISLDKAEIKADNSYASEGGSGRVEHSRLQRSAMTGHTVEAGPGDVRHSFFDRKPGVEDS